MAEPPLPSPEHAAELARRGAELRAAAERLVTDALAAVAGDPALGPAAADVGAYLARRDGHGSVGSVVGKPLRDQI